jgi:hypothetical protein
MRTIVKWTAIPALLAAVACQDRKVDDDLASDLALISGPDIELANAAANAASVVSAVENIPAPSPRTNPSPAKKRGTKAPPPERSMVDLAAAEPTSEAQQMVNVSESDTPVAADANAPDVSDAPPVVRPQPVEPRYPVGNGSIFGTGTDDRARTGGGVVVIRGGSDGRDDCAIHDRARGRRTARGPGVLINNRIPGVGTFPQY